MERTTTFIYSLSCPISGDVRYIGKSNNPKLRFYKHLQMLDNNKDKNFWIKELLSDESKPILTIVEEVLISEWKDKEKLYIGKFRELGCDLLNSSIGGEGLDFGNKTSFKPGEGSKKITCLLSDGSYHKTFDSAKDAASYIGKHNISSALKGVTKKAGGYIWIYEDKFIKMTKDELSIFIENANNNKSSLNGTKSRFSKGHNTWNKKSVNQYTLDDIFIKTWEDVTTATLSFGGSRNNSSISMCAKGNRKTAFGYKWKY